MIQLFRLSTKGVMLGKYDDNLSKVSYNRVAKDGEYTYFEMDNWDEIYKLVNESDDEMWKINKQFIDNQKALNKEFYFSQEPWKFRNSLHLVICVDVHIVFRY